MKKAAVVIWYNPRPEFVENIRSFLGHVQAVIVVDNSEGDNSHLLGGLERVQYFPQLENKGIAAALNIGCEIAKQLGVEWVLTMDQDSSFDPSDISTLISLVSTIEADSAIAIFAPGKAKTASGKSSDRDSVITSGSLLHLMAWEKVGGFNEELFIDQVDHEFCFRLRREGFRIIAHSGIRMRHQIGDPITRTFFGRRVFSTNHSHIRRYYMVRNRLFMRRAFKDFKKPYVKMITTDFFKILFLEKDKKRKIFAMAAGIRDYLAGRLGKW